jgi:hypothetical protein
MKLIASTRRRTLDIDLDAGTIRVGDFVYALDILADGLETPPGKGLQHQQIGTRRGRLSPGSFHAGRGAAMIAGRLTMRALVERNQATATDTWGQPVKPAFASTGDPVPCFVWSNSSQELVDGAKSAQIEQLRALFGLGADVQADDEIASITDRAGTEIIPGRLQIMGPVQRKHTHLEADLRRVA